MIAISYRREDSLPIAGRLYDRLQAKFGKKNVFMDFDSIPPGADFRQHIKQMIERSKLVIAIIGPQWLGEQPDASRRIDNPADFVRLEIGYALEAGIPVIPLLINTTPMPKPEMLPPDIQELAFRHALPLDSGMDFHSHAERLIIGIGKAMDVTPRSRGPRKVPEPTASASNRRSLRKIVTRSAAILLTIAASALTAWYFATHRREPAKPVVEQDSQPPVAKPATLSIASITKEHPYVNSLGMKFVPVVGTRVLFSVWDTRVKDYKVFIDAAKRDWPTTDFKPTEEDPAVNVSWDDATEFCKWLTEKEQKTGLISATQSYRLPTDLEWSSAAGLEKESGSTPEQRDGKVKGVYPWRTAWPPPKSTGNYDPSLNVDDYEKTSPVGSFEANQYGLYDLGGNVWQWCQDWWNGEHKYRVLRGASWNNGHPGALLSSFRSNVAPEDRSGNRGFRCVLLSVVSTKDEKSSAPAKPLSPSVPADNTGAQKLTKVFVKKYGFSALLPTEFFPDAALQLADANTDRVVSVNGCFRVAFNLLSGPVKKAYDNCIAELRKKADHRTIDYKVLKEGWFVVSGDSDTSGYYTKGVKRGGGDVIVMQLEYTGDACNVTDAILTEMSRQFDGN